MGGLEDGGHQELSGSQHSRVRPGRSQSHRDPRGRPETEYSPLRSRRAAAHRPPFFPSPRCHLGEEREKITKVKDLSKKMELPKMVNLLD